MSTPFTPLLAGAPPRRDRARLLLVGLLALSLLAPAGAAQAQDLPPLPEPPSQSATPSNTPTTAPAPADAPADTALQARAQTAPYIVGPGDVLGIQVLNQPEFSQNDLLVRGDGQASFPGVGEVPVQGRSLSEVADAVAQRLKTWVVDPQVNVTVQRTRPGTVYLTGAVMHPGMYQLTTDPKATITAPGQVQIGAPPTPQSLSRLDLRLSNVLSNAGGVAMDADLSRVSVTRAQTGETQTVNLWQVLKTGEDAQDVWIRSGDRISVPRMSRAMMNDEDYDLLLRSAIGPSSFPVRVMGQVNQGGVVALSGESPYLNSALAKAGGLKPDGKVNRVVIRRMVDAQTLQTLVVNPHKTDLTLRPNDVVWVPERPLYRGGRAGDQVTKFLSPLTALGSTAFNAAFLIRGF